MSNFLDAYFETLLWSTIDDEGNPLDENFGAEDIVGHAYDAHVVELNAWVIDNLDLIIKLVREFPHVTVEQIAHDIALTRNRHGAGFWDRGYGALGEILSNAAHSMGSAELYVTDNGLKLVID